MSDLVYQAYGDALFQVGKSNNKLEIFYDEIQVIKSCISKPFLSLLKNPNISKEEKVLMMEEVFKNNDPLLKNFFKILVSKNRFDYVLEILKYYEASYFAFHDIQEVFVTSATELSEEQLQKIKSKFEKKYQKNIKMNIEIDEKLIAGLIVKVNDEVYDNSVKGQLLRLKESI